MKSAQNRNLFTPRNGGASFWYLVPLAVHSLWIAFLFFTIFTIPFSLFSNGFVIASLLVRALLLFIGIMAFRRIYFQGRVDAHFHELWKHYTGYAVVLTYVFCIFPQVVRDFYKTSPEPQGAGFVAGVLLTSLFPALLYLLLANDRVRLALGGYKKEDLADRQELKKDKVLQKKRRKELKKKRNPAQNLWYEWVEPILGAILWVLVINHLAFQLYQIPSESMVPTFLIKDRVVVTKTQYGPTIPLTEYRLPSFSTPKTGQIVTFASPEMDDPGSTLRYKNVFTRVFQPFIYIITFTKVDIDSDDQGNPKARLLVKRVAAEPAEKLCILNDRVYKKTVQNDWAPMETLPGQEEYGRTDLFYSENPLMNYQRMNPSIRELMDGAIALVDGTVSGDLEALLVKEKETFLRMVALRNPASLNRDLGVFLEEARKTNEELKSQLSYYLRYFSYINTLEISESEKANLINLFKQSLDLYGGTAFYGALRDLSEYLASEASRGGYLETAIGTSVSVPSGADPYQDFMIRANAVDKYWRLVFYNALLGEPRGNLPGLLSETMKTALSPRGREDIPGLENLLLMDVYTRGLEQPSMGNRISFHTYFEVMQFPAFPQGREEYLKEDEYFLMGDNRYNSLDARLGRDTRFITLDPADTGAFSRSIEVSWDGHVMTKKHIQGKVRFILFPFNRLRFF